MDLRDSCDTLPRPFSDSDRSTFFRFEWNLALEAVHSYIVSLPTKKDECKQTANNCHKALSLLDTLMCLLLLFYALAQQHTVVISNTMQARSDEQNSKQQHPTKKKSKRFSGEGGSWR
jgi:hypothetical protein